ncbi:MAG: cyanophycinase, partial [Mycobacterium sp.]|nr:cyanophycinase [Mycobacterium sp.]
QMEEVDRLLLERVGGPAARVVVLPTAAGLEEPASPQRWANLGVRHFTRLGANTEAINILRREDAFDPRWLPLLERADLIYFSGGSPRHLVDTLSDSPAWEVIRLRYAAGAVLAGCSAGAMAFGHVTLQPRRLWTGGVTNGSLPADTWYPALGLLPGVVALPHFDRWIRRMGQPVLKQLAASLPAGVSLVGVDEDTALVDFHHDGVWHVLGRQGVSVIDAEDGENRYMSGASVDLSAVRNKLHECP